MAYQVPEQWSHGEYPTAAKINKYKDGLDATHALLGDARIHPAVQLNQAGDVILSYHLIHRHRWLIYRGAGNIDDPANVGEAVALSAADGGGWTSYDLAQVSWLTPGRLYEVEGVVGCFEDYEAYS